MLSPSPALNTGAALATPAICGLSLPVVRSSLQPPRAILVQLKAVLGLDSAVRGALSFHGGTRSSLSGSSETPVQLWLQRGRHSPESCIPCPVRTNCVLVTISNAVDGCSRVRQVVDTTVEHAGIPEMEYGTRLTVFGKCWPSLGVFPNREVPSQECNFHAMSGKCELPISYTFPRRTLWCSLSIPSLIRLHGEAIVNT